MINVTLLYRGGVISGFTAENHGKSEVCAAVSLLILNAANSIEALTDAALDCEYNEAGGYIRFRLAGRHADAELLLRAAELGVRSVEERYPGEITVKTADGP
jgi:uncharacterized protein YsxB (DUF464 family)